MSNVVDFFESKAIRDRSRSCHFVSLDLFYDENFQVWASVTNVDMQDVDADWHRHVAHMLRKLAWVSEGQASNMDGTATAPIASITVFEDARVSTIYNDDLLQTVEQVNWVRDQLNHGVDEIGKNT